MTQSQDYGGGQNKNLNLSWLIREKSGKKNPRNQIHIKVQYNTQEKLRVCELGYSWMHYTTSGEDL